MKHDPRDVTELLTAAWAVLDCKMIGGSLGEGHYRIPTKVRDRLWVVADKMTNREPEALPCVRAKAAKERRRG